MRIVLIGVSHWHTPFYLDPSLDLPDVTIVGVSDPDVTRAGPAAAKAGCPAFADYKEMCAGLKPDFAFALGRHCDMAEEARFLIDHRIPSIADLADNAAAVALIERAYEMSPLG